jgi:hypothetical protein
VASLNTEGHSVLEKVTQILNKKVYEYRITTSGFTLVYNPPANNTEYLVGDFPDLKTHPLDPNIPPGAEVVEAWVVPLDGVNDITKFFRFYVERTKTKYC